MKIQFFCSVRFALQAVFALMLLSIMQTNSYAQSFSFRSLATDREIELFPLADHHRIRFQVRVAKGAGCRAFAQLVAHTPDSPGDSTSTTCEFQITTDDETWEIYLRAPRFGTTTAEYTIYAGIADASQLDEFSPSIGYKWEVRRNASRTAQFITQIDGKPMDVHVRVRNASYTGGELRVYVEEKTLAVGGIRLVQVSTSKPVDGLQAVRKVN